MFLCAATDPGWACCALFTCLIHSQTHTHTQAVTDHLPGNIISQILSHLRPAQSSPVRSTKEAGTNCCLINYTGPPSSSLPVFQSVGLAMLHCVPPLSVMSLSLSHSPSSSSSSSQPPCPKTLLTSSLIVALIVVCYCVCVCDVCVMCVMCV